MFDPEIILLQLMRDFLSLSPWSGGLVLSIGYKNCCFGDYGFMLFFREKTVLSYLVSFP